MVENNPPRPEHFVANPFAAFSYGYPIRDGPTLRPRLMVYTASPDFPPLPAGVSSAAAAGDGRVPDDALPR